VVLLVWVYYSTQILLLGAEFTQVYAIKYGSGLRVLGRAKNPESVETDNPRVPAAACL